MMGWLKTTFPLANFHPYFAGFLKYNSHTNLFRIFAKHFRTTFSLAAHHLKHLQLLADLPPPAPFPPFFASAKLFAEKLL